MVLLAKSSTTHASQSTARDDYKVEQHTSHVKLLRVSRVSRMQGVHDYYYRRGREASSSYGRASIRVADFPARPILGTALSPLPRIWHLASRIRKLACFHVLEKSARLAEKLAHCEHEFAGRLAVTRPWNGRL